MSMKRPGARLVAAAVLVSGGVVCAAPAPPAAAATSGRAFAAVGYYKGRATLIAGRLGGAHAVIFRGDQPAAVATPAVSPDGGRVAYIEIDGAQSPRVAVIDVDGTHHQLLTPDVTDRDLSTPVWSPDGRRIYVGVRNMERAAFYRLGVVPADGTGRLTFPTNNRNIRPESFRPDGRVLAFDFMRSGDRWESTGVIHRDGTGRRAVGPTNLWNATWRPNTHTLAVSRVLRDDGGGVTIQVQLVNTRTGRFHPVAITQSASAYGAAYPLGWSKDGSHLFYEHFSYRNGDQVDPRIYRIRADGTGRTDLTPSHLVGWYGQVAVQGR